MELDDKLQIKVEVQLDPFEAERELKRLRKEIEDTIKTISSMEQRLAKGWGLYQKSESRIADEVATEMFREDLQDIEKEFRNINSEIEKTIQLSKRWQHLLSREIISGKRLYSTDEYIKNAQHLEASIKAYKKMLSTLMNEKNELVFDYRLMSPEELKNYKGVFEKNNINEDFDEEDEEEFRRAIASKQSKKKVVPKLPEPTPKAETPSIVGEMDRVNTKLKKTYDVLRSTKATRMDKNLQLFTASIFEGIMEAFDSSMRRALPNKIDAINEVTMGRRLAGLAVKPEKFYLALLTEVFKGNTTAFDEYMRKFGVELTPDKFITDKKGRLLGLDMGIDPLKVIRDLAVRGFSTTVKGPKGEEEQISLSKGFRTGLLQGMVSTVGVQISSLLAKVGIIGVILKKIYEVLEKMVRFSGIMAASLKILTLIVQLVIKPVADILGSLLLPILMVVLRSILPLIKVWNKIFGSWMRTTKEHSTAAPLTQLISTLIGFAFGGVFGGFAGAVLPMILNYVKDKLSSSGIKMSSILKLTPLGILFNGPWGDITDQLSTLAKDVLPLFTGAVIGVVKVFAIFGKVIGLGSSVITTVATKVSAVFSALSGVAHTVYNAFVRVKDAIVGFIEGLISHFSFLTGGHKTTSSTTSSSDSGIISEYTDLQGDRWNALAQQMNSDAVLEEMQKLTTSIDTSEFDNIIKSANEMENNLSNAMGQLSDTSKQVNNDANDTSDIFVDLFNNTYSPISNAIDFWRKKGSDIPNAAQQLYNVTKGVFNKATDIMSNVMSAISLPGNFTPMTVNGEPVVKPVLRTPSGEVIGEITGAYQSGGWVKETGLALVHEGEYIVPRQKAFDIADLLRGGLIYKPPVFREPPIYHNDINVNISVERMDSNTDIEYVADRVSEILFEKLRMHIGGY